MSKNNEVKRHPSTLAAQANGWLDSSTNAVIPSIHPSTTYARDQDYELVDGRGYTRDENPTYLQVESLLSKLESGKEALLFASGMAAATAILLALKPGDHIVAPSDVYFGLRSWLIKVGLRWGLKIDFVQAGNLEAISESLIPGVTKIVWVETPCNPMCTITDIKAVADITHRAGAKLVVDSTMATPVLTQPLALGADIVMHSATKYLNGHSDVLAGALITANDDELWQRISALRYQNGGVLGPFVSWLLLRGIRTLFLRVERSSSTALSMANYFTGHNQLTEVLYPGLKHHKDYRVAIKQMIGGFGGVLSIRIKGGRDAAISVAKSVQLFVPATSLGGVESLIEHRATIEGSESPIPDDLLRLSIGIEDPNDLITDIDQALSNL